MKKSIEYNFPKTIYAEKNTFHEQVEHFLSEAQEVREVMDAVEQSWQETGDVPEPLIERLLEELADAYHSIETTFRILDREQSLVPSLFNLVEQKNRERGYYDTEEEG